MICKDGIHYFNSEAWDSRCECLLWSRREHRNRQARQQIKSGSRQLWKQAKKEWALDKMGVPVIQIKDNEPVAVYRSIVEAGLALGIYHRNICQVTKGKRKTVGGYKWEIA